MKKFQNTFDKKYEFHIDIAQKTFKISQFLYFIKFKIKL